MVKLLQPVTEDLIFHIHGILVQSHSVPNDNEIERKKETMWLKT